MASRSDDVEATAKRLWRKFDGTGQCSCHNCGMNADVIAAWLRARDRRAVRLVREAANHYAHGVCRNPGEVLQRDMAARVRDAATRAILASPAKGGKK